jgi:hypothetical protein
MQRILTPILFTLCMMYILAWTSIISDLTGIKQLSIWYAIAYFGGANI